ncbi:hypothetical protein [Salinibacter ruber]|uniref:hypothetical protein n=1 Tax=Salinibacter ruber TaxID=146919 RepID=UPI00216826D2|nr:hypothetical protein [Salinibacter ruber]
MHSLQNGGEVPNKCNHSGSKELARRLFTIANNRPDGAAQAAWTELCLVLEAHVGTQGRLYKKSASLSSRAGNVAWNEESSVPNVLSFETSYDHSGGMTRARTHVRVGKDVSDTRELCDRLGVSYSFAASAAADAESRQELAQALAQAGAPTETGAGEGRGAGERGEGRGEGEGERATTNVGALSYGNSPSTHEANPSSAAAEGENRGGESMWKSHVGGEMRDKVPVPKPVSDALEEILEEIDAGQYIDVLRRVIAHVYYCQTRMPDRYDDGVPLGHLLIRQACSEDESAAIPTRTEEVWEGAEGIVLAVNDYIYREEDVGRSRQFLVREKALSRLDKALSDSYEYKTRYNLVDGKRLYSGFQTELTYDGEHSWEERSTFIYRVLKRLKGQRDLVNKSAVEDHLDGLEDDVEAAKARHEAADEEREQLEDEILEEGKSLTDAEQTRLKEAREAAFEAGRELERIRSRYRQDIRIWSDIISQGLEDAEDQPEGIYEYETAYEVQEASGRFTQTCGLQNASEDMKAAACKDVAKYNNLDISSSQTEALIQEMRMAVRMGAELDVSILTGYIDEDGKDGLAKQFGVDREHWKRPEHAVKFGAGFTHPTFEAVHGAAQGKVLARIKDSDDDPDFSELHQFENESGRSAWRRAVYNELPTMAQTARDWADDEDIRYDDPEEIYSILKDAYAEMAEEIDAWRDWLVDEHWTKVGQHGSGFGYYVSNPCSLPFSIYDPRLAESNEEGAQPDRYNQKTGYATSRLQGLEVAYIHALALIQDDFDYEFLRNEHDGAVILGEVPEEAREMARRISGFHRAELESKPFESSDSSPCASRSSTSMTNESTGSPNTNPESRSGARTDRMPSGSAATKRTNSKSGTASTSPAEASFSKSSPGEKQNASKGSPDMTTGSTSRDQEEEVVEAYVQKRRRMACGDVPPDPQEAMEQGFSMSDWKAVHV